MLLLHTATVGERTTLPRTALTEPATAGLRKINWRWLSDCGAISYHVAPSR